MAAHHTHRTMKAALALTCSSLYPPGLSPQLPGLLSFPHVHMENHTRTPMCTCHLTY